MVAAAAYSRFDVLKDTDGSFSNSKDGSKDSSKESSKREGHEQPIYLSVAEASQRAAAARKAAEPRKGTQILTSTTADGAVTTKFFGPNGHTASTTTPAPNSNGNGSFTGSNSKHGHGRPKRESSRRWGRTRIGSVDMDSTLDRSNHKVVSAPTKDTPKPDGVARAAIDGVIRYVHNGKSCMCSLVHFTASRHKAKPFFQRVLRLDGNHLVLPLPPLRPADPVGADLKDIPGVLRSLQTDFASTATSLNLSTAWTFANRLRRRMRLQEQGKADGSVDLLIVGCEASLWVGEQFAADISLIFPGLKVVTLSANKVLGLMGQKFPIPQEGFSFSANSYSFRDTIVLLLSHSGGTFATLSVCHLLKNLTADQFVVSSEWDTQLARAVREANLHSPSGQKGVRKSPFSSHTFSTFAGVRTAEACSLSVVAMHSLLTHVLIFTMNYLCKTELGHSSYAPEEVQELAYMHPDHLQAVEMTLGVKHVDSVHGGHVWTPDVKEMRHLSVAMLELLNVCKMPRWMRKLWFRYFGGKRFRQQMEAEAFGMVETEETESNRMLRTQGRRWALHILEGPCSWLLSSLYIIGTVLAGATPLTAVFDATLPASAMPDDGSRAPWQYGVAAADALLYMFLPIWTSWLLRLLQGRAPCLVGGGR